MDQDEKVRENRLRRIAERQGLAVVKSRRRDPLALDFDRWMIVDPSANNVVVAGTDGTGRPNMDLDQVEEYFTERGLEVDLKRAGMAFVKSGGANRDRMRSLVREAMKNNLDPDFVHAASGVPLEDIRALNREAEEGK